MDGSETDGEFLLIQTFLLYYVNQVILMLTSIFQGQFPQQSKVGLYQNKFTVSLTFTRHGGQLLGLFIPILSKLRVLGQRQK